MLVRRWTPPSQVPTSSSDTPPSTQRTCARWCKVLIFALIASALVCFAVIYPLQKEDLFNRDYSHRKQHEHEQEQRLAFDNYIQDMSNTLVQTAQLSEKYLHIQARTLLILRTLDVQRKAEILLFLYQRHLLDNNQLNLQGADLNHVQLTCPNDFHHLHLIGVQWSNAVFINCHLKSSNFNRAYLRHVRFNNCTLDNASFVDAHLEQGQFIETSVRHVDFTGASLIGANFLSANIVQGNRFINADLYQSKFTDDQLEGRKFSVIKHDFHHARYPNGSFGLIDLNENLISNGNLGIECNNSQLMAWNILEGNLTWTTENTTTNETREEKCFLIISTNTRVYQNIDLHSYSLLINTNNAMIFFEAFAGCNQSYFEIRTYRSDGLQHPSKRYSEPKTNIINDEKMYQYGEDQYRLLSHTQRLEIHFGIDHLESNSRCHFGDMTLMIRYHQIE